MGDYQYSGMAGYQAKMADVGFESQMASAGASIANTKRGWMYTSGIGLSKATNPLAGKSLDWSATGAVGQAFQEGQGNWYWQDQQTKLQRTQQRWQLGQQGAQLQMGQTQFDRGQTLSLAQTLEKFMFGRAQTNTQYGWQQQDFSLQRNQQLMQRGWQRQDHTFQVSELNRNFGYSQEDYAFNIRYATGRERIQMERQQKRDVTGHNIQEDRANIEESRAKKTWKLEDERYAIDVNRAEIQYKWSLQSSDMDLKHFEQNQAMELQNFNERQALQMADYGKQMQWLTEQETQTDALTQLQKAQAQADMQASIDQAGAQAGYAAQQKAMSEEMSIIQDKLDAQYSKSKLDMWANMDLFTTVLSNRIRELIVALVGMRAVQMGGSLDQTADPTISGKFPVDTTPSNTKLVLDDNGKPIRVPDEDPRPAINGATGGRSPAGRARIVGELGPELFTPDTDGYITPNNRLANLASFHAPLSGGSSSTTEVHVYLDGKEISGHMVTKLAGAFNAGRRM